MIRKSIALLLGVSTGLISVLLIRTFSLTKYPFPTNLDWTNIDDRNIYIASLPDAAFIIVMISHIIGTFLAGLIAALVCRKDRFAVGILSALVLFVFILVTNFTHNYPKLYLMIDVFLTTTAGFAGASLGRSRDT